MFGAKSTAGLSGVRPGLRQVTEGSGEQGKMEKTGCKIICGALTTLAVKGLMMMMMMTTAGGYIRARRKDRNFRIWDRLPHLGGKKKKKGKEDEEEEREGGGGRFFFFFWTASKGGVGRK